MKKFSLICLSILCEVLFSYGADEGFDRLLSGNYHRYDELIASFDINDVTNLIELSRDGSVPVNIRLDSLRIISEMRSPDFFLSLVDLYKDIRAKTLACSKYNNSDIISSTLYYDELSCFNLVLIALGKISSPEVIQFLKSEFDRDIWKSREIQNYTDELLDDQIRLKVFIALAEAAVYTFPLFEYLEDIQKKSSGGFKINIDSLLPEYKEKYYQKNPAELPEKGYIFELCDDPYTSINNMSWKFQKYFERNSLAV